jgi:hypothetical protein
MTFHSSCLLSNTGKVSVVQHCTAPSFYSSVNFLRSQKVDSTASNVRVNDVLGRTWKEAVVA